MPVQHVNRKGKTYFLHQGKTKKGNPKYIFSQSEEQALNAIPEGYETYENPNAQVFLRKIQPKLITKAEETFVKERLKTLIERKYCKITVDKGMFRIYLAGHDVDRMREIWGNTLRAKKEGIETLIDQEITYSPVVQLVLQSPDNRLFVLKMVDYEKGNRVWETVDAPGSLDTLMEIVTEEMDIETDYSFPF